MEIYVMILTGLLFRKYANLSFARKSCESGN